MGRFANSWYVFKQSLTVLKQDKELLFLPVVSGIASLVAVFLFISPLVVTGTVQRAFQQDPGDPNAQFTFYAVIFVLYLLLSFITIFFQSALIFGANERLAGGDPTVGSALRGASKRIGKIFAWSLVAATVSLLIHAIENGLRRTRGGNLAASLVGTLLGTAWALLTYFVIPIVVFEGTGPFAALKRSGQLFKKRWGEQVIGDFGIGLAMFALTFGGLLIGLLLLYLASGLGAVAVGVVIAAIVLWLIFTSILGQALGGVYKTALYRYANQGEIASQYTPEAIQGAYRPKYVSSDRL